MNQVTPGEDGQDIIKPLPFSVEAMPERPGALTLTLTSHFDAARHMNSLEGELKEVIDNVAATQRGKVIMVVDLSNHGLLNAVGVGENFSKLAKIFWPDFFGDNVDKVAYVTQFSLFEMVIENIRNNPLRLSRFNAVLFNTMEEAREHLREKKDF